MRTSGKGNVTPTPFLNPFLSGKHYTELEEDTNRTFRIICSFRTGKLFPTGLLHTADYFPLPPPPPKTLKGDRGGGGGQSKFGGISEFIVHWFNKFPSDRVDHECIGTAGHT